MKSKVADWLQHPVKRLGLCARWTNNFLRQSRPRVFAILVLALLVVGSSKVSAATWMRQPSGTMAWLHSIYFLDQQRGWVSGSNGTLLRTLDGGASWKKVPVPSRDNLRDVYFADKNLGWVLAERDALKVSTNDEPRSYLLQTEDAGFSWRQIFLDDPTSNARLVR